MTFALILVTAARDCRKSPRRGAECDAVSGSGASGRQDRAAVNRPKIKALARRLMGKAIGSWRLFWVLAVAISTLVCLGLPSTDFHSARGMEPIILRSVRCALPLFLVAFAASSLTTLWPSRATRWLLANRRYIGLAFAFAMAWHFSFVAYSIWMFGNRLNAKATALDVIGLIFLLLLTLTSFRWSKRRLSAATWRRLHKSGVYVIWLLATEILFGIVRHGGDRLHDVLLSLFLAAWLLRVAAWMKQRLRYAARDSAILAGSPRSSR
jgi:methionine sulfoxide reductase heme-binding subunit